MPPAPRKRARGHLGRGTLLSLLLHAQVILPLGIAAFIYGGREDARRAEEIDVGFESVPEEQLPADLPALEPPKGDETALERLKPDAKKPPKKKPERDKKLAELEKAKPKPEPEIIAPPMPPMPQAPPPPPPERKGHEKMVDVENDKDVPPPPDAKFLAEKNNRVEQETRATETNLERNQ